MKTKTKRKTVWTAQRSADKKSFRLYRQLPGGSEGLVATVSSNADGWVVIPQYAGGRTSRKRWASAAIAVQKRYGLPARAGIDAITKLDTPMCEQCDEEMHPFTDSSTGKDGFGCDSCGWSFDIDS